MRSKERPQAFLDIKLTRKELLALGGLMAFGAATHGALSPSKIPEIKGRQPVQSPYFATAMYAVNQQVKESATRETMQAILEDTDRQGIANFSIFRSSKFPGVEFPVTTVSINRLLGLEVSEEPERKKTFVIFPGFSWPKAGHPFTPWDIAYDRVFKALPRVAAAKVAGQTPEQTEIIVAGSPNSWWGSVTPQWIEYLKIYGLSPYANLYREYLETQLPAGNRSKTSLVLQGVSLGAAVAKFTAESLANLKPEFANLRLRLDNPIGLTMFPGLSFAQAQIILGFAGEGIIRTLYTDREKAVGRDEGPFYEAANRVLSARGITPNDQGSQPALKQAAAERDILNVLEGPKQQAKNQVRAYIAQGVYDPLTATFARWKRRQDLISAGKNPIIGLSNGFEILTVATHYVERMSAKRWATLVESSQRMRLSAS